MITEIRPAQLASWIGSVAPSEAIVLDVREPLELQTASVSANGFKLVAIPMGQIPASLNDLEKDAPIACLCHHGARSMRVAQYLSQNGFTNVVNIGGGIDAWSAEVDPAVPRY